MDYKFLVEEAIEAQKNSFSPFYNFHVGAALLTEDDKIIRGCNVESSANGGVCAERVAFLSAIANGNKKFKAIAVVGGDLQNFCTPCGICRQFMVDFAPDIDIVLYKKDEIKVVKLKDLLPDYFTDMVNPEFVPYIDKYYKK